MLFCFHFDVYFNVPFERRRDVLLQQFGKGLLFLLILAVGYTDGIPLFLYFQKSFKARISQKARAEEAGGDQV